VAAWIKAQFPRAQLHNNVHPQKFDADHCTQRTAVVICEDKPLRAIAAGLRTRPHARCILVLRDPRNMIASRLWRSANRPQARSLMNVDRGVRHWTAVAREVLGHTRILPNPTCLVYDRWFISAAYREQLGGSLGLPDPAPALQTVPRFGQGSSFDGVEYDGRADQMRVLTRYQAMLDDATYQATITTTLQRLWYRLV